MSDERCALVLEGGAMRGMYTAESSCLWTMILALMLLSVFRREHFGVNMLSKQRGRVIRYNKRFNSDKNYMGIRPLLGEKT